MGNAQFMTTTNQIANLITSLDFQASLWSGLILFGLGIIFKVYQARPRLAWGMNHQFVFGLKPQDPTDQKTQPMALFTRTIHVVNEGTASATDVEVHFTAKPAHFQLWPTFDYEPVLLADGGFLIRVKNLGIREAFSVELLQINSELPNVIRVRSSRGEAPFINVAPSRVVGPWLTRALVALWIVGAFAIVRWLAEIIIAARS